MPKKCLLRPPPAPLSQRLDDRRHPVPEGLNPPLQKYPKFPLVYPKLKAESIPRKLKIKRLCYEMSRSFPIHFFLGLLKYSVNVLSVERNRRLFSIFFFFMDPVLNN